MAPQNFAPIEIAVAGTGPAGLAMALALTRSGFDVRLFGPKPLGPSAMPDTRTAALLAPSIAFLEGLEVWPRCAAEAAPLRRLILTDQSQRLLRAPDVCFDAGEIGADAFGYNIPNAVLVAALFTALQARAGVFHETGGVTGITPGAEAATLETAEGAKFSAALVIGADGRASLSRACSGIAAREWAYGHTAVACSFEHSAPHRHTCVELHRAGGPFTVVPLPGNRSSLVWVERPAEAGRLMALDDAAFAAAIEANIGAFLGSIVAAGKRTAFPLSGLAVGRYGQNRIALIGEAAHVVPPIGAQGLNLGFRDAADLARILDEKRSAGADLGGGGVLAAYSAARRSDVWSRTLAADMLNRTLITGFAPFDLARSFGLAALARSGPLRRFMMRRGLGPQSSAIVPAGDAANGANA